MDAPALPDALLPAAVAARLSALGPYEIMNSPPEAAFNRVVEMVGELFGTASAYVNFLDGCVQWSKAFYGSDLGEVAADESFCTHAVSQDGLFVVLDALRDRRFCGLPAVVGGPKIRFYAGAVLRSSGGVPIGTLCLMDPRPRGTFGERERKLLQNFAAIVMDELELRHSLHELTLAKAGLQSLNRQLYHDARHDPLTGLPNRAYFNEVLAQTLKTARSPFALLFLDFDGFKVVNDSLGHNVGDEVLVVLARRLRHNLGEDDVLARFGGDEFCVLLRNVSPTEALAVAERLRRHFHQPMKLGGRRLRLGVSVGVVASAPHYAHPEELLRDADTAMYAAKRCAGGVRGAVRLFQAPMHERALRRLDLEEELREALHEGRLSVHYQPIVGPTGEVVAAEALARWPHPERGLVPAGDFIPLAEEAGLIVELDRFVLREAVRQAALWHRQGRACRVSVNLSSRHVTQPGLGAWLQKLLVASGLPPRQLVLELTENTFLADGEALNRTLTELKTLGVRLALDDFGTGYSALAYLRRLPLDILKLDGSFVRGLTRSPKDAEVVKTILALAQVLGLETVAEGVETAAQREVLTRLGCTYLQGFLMSGALPATDLEARLRPPAPLVGR